MDEQTAALSEARLMDEGSTMRISELACRNELAEDGAQHIVTMKAWQHVEDFMVNWRMQRCNMHAFTEYSESLKQRDERIQRQRLLLQEGDTRLHQVKTLADIGMDQMKVKLKDAGSKLKGEVVEQRRRANFYENECMGKGPIEEQLCHEKQMILDNEASVTAVMENFREENSEPAEVNNKFRTPITDVINNKLGDGPPSPHAVVTGELQGELARL
eukprot:s446_g22.t1